MKLSDSQNLTIAANQGEFGGGEVMLLAIGRAARELGYIVTIVAPSTPAEVLNEAKNQGFSVVAIPSSTTGEYLLNLRRWDRRERQGLLWCNGLRPALATSGHRNRVVHLHQEPTSKQKLFAHAARFGAIAAVVPSNFMAKHVSNTITLLNWTLPMKVRPTQEHSRNGCLTVGYLGRLSKDKGVDVLCDAVSELVSEGRNIQLIIAGESRFVADDEAREIREHIESLGHRASYLGWMDRDDFFATVDLAVFPSTWGEPFGLVAAEAMAARCPFVISDAGALPEVAGEDFPYIAPAGNAQALAQTIARALDDRDPQILDESFFRWDELFSPAAGLTRLSDALEKFTGRKPLA